MLSEKQLEAVESTAEELKRRRDNRPAGERDENPAAVPKKRSQREQDRAWAKANLRFKAGEPYCDSANVLRILDRHPAFKGRFKYNENLNKVMDKGAVMLDWRVADLVVTIQERFIPEVPVDVVEKGLIVHANRAMQKN